MEKTVENTKKAIKHYECERKGAVVVLDSGFGQKEGENNCLYVRRKLYSELAIDALEKQLAKKPIENKHNGLQADYVLYACPNCKQEFQPLEDITGICNQQEKPFYCTECGQKIDWD